jgi:hypothetical protein
VPFFLLSYILFVFLTYLLAISSPPPDFSAMGRQPDNVDKLFALATTNGYKRGEYREKDVDPSPYIYMKRSVYDQDSALCRYMI